MASLWQKKIALVPVSAGSGRWMGTSHLPETPGVYFFLDADQHLLYIGKATSLRDRVKSYFAQDMSRARGPKITRMLAQASHVAYRETDSVLEALILEAALIKAHQPLYNTDAKDDKSYQHVIITEERYPRVLLVRGRDLERRAFPGPIRYVFGPFPAGGALREGLKIIRKLFPYRDRCIPYTALPAVKRPDAKPCFSAQIGLCPGVCSGKISAQAYAQTIRHIRLLFEGRKTVILRKLEREMRVAIKERAFEVAGALHKTLFGLRHIQDISLLKNERSAAQPTRIEAYDVAHLGGEASVGVMTVMTGTQPDSSQYRQFKLRGEHEGNDLTALEEILTRRFRHAEWPFPSMIVVDGGELQCAVAQRVLASQGLALPIIGVVKNKKHQLARLIGPPALLATSRDAALLANSEAHRFALRFHRKRRSQAFLPGEL